jgi:hypothetical protein
VTRQFEGGASSVWANGRKIPVERRAIPKPEAKAEVEAAGIDVRGELEKLCGRIRRLFPMSGNPEAFHVEKDSICNDLMSVSRSLPRRLAYQKPAAKR